MRKHRHFLVAALAAALMACAAAALDHPLTNSAVREAYFLGQRRDSSTADFLAKYVKRLPATRTGWQIVEVEVRTPYAQLVRRSQQSLPGYSAQQAWEEYRKHPPDVMVRVYLAAPLTEVVREDAWRDFQFRAQQEKELRSNSIFGNPVYSFAGVGRSSTLIGAEVFLEFAAERISNSPLRIDVKAPDGRVISASFDLSRLK